MASRLARSSRPGVSAPGLREAKKRRAHAALLAAAEELFEERGFAATRVREIAERAQLSHATFFNYFAGRDGLVSDWIETRLDEVFLEAAEAAHGRALRPAVRRSLRSFADRIEARSSWLAEMWPRGRHAGIHAHAGAQRLVADAQKRGDLRRDVAPDQLGPLLAGVAQAAVADWFARAQRSEPLERHLLRAVELVLDGARARNERVRPRAR